MLKNIAVLIYIFASYGIGVGCLTQQPWQLNGIGVVLLIHALILSAIFIHELIHGNIFKERQYNQFWGEVLTHLNGACYATWDDLVEHHINHHIHHADFVPFEISKYISELPIFQRQVVIALEWAYFPAFEFILRLRIALGSFQASEKQNLRSRTLFLMLYRGVLFAILGWYAPKAIALYALAYISFINLMRFADAFHHTYNYAIVGEPFPKRDRVYEQANTFSNLVSIKYPWLNLLYLNFGYHNAHHEDMRCSWYNLPKLHEKLYGTEAHNLLPLPQLIANYHHFRLERLFGGQGDVDKVDIAAFIGGIGVSLLTPP
jgi:fatty acid desaturase